MKKTIGLLLALAFLLAVPAAAEPHEVTLTGEYYWNQGHSGDLKAVFTPAEAEGTWDVTFYFDFRDKPRVYTGVVKGSLEGALEGEVKNEDKKRTFLFDGKFEGGQFEGEHEEITPGRERQTGTLTLSR